MAIKRRLKNNTVNPLYLIVNKINGYIEENNEDKYLTLVLTDGSKYILKSKEIWAKIRDLIRSKNNNTDKYDEKSNLIRVMIYH